VKSGNLGTIPISPEIGIVPRFPRMNKAYPEFIEETHRILLGEKEEGGGMEIIGIGPPFFGIFLTLLH
jgi:hypothetical protein